MSRIRNNISEREKIPSTYLNKMPERKLKWLMESIIITIKGILLLEA